MSQLSPQSEQFLEQAVAAGWFPSKEAALDAAVRALQDARAELPLIADDHLDAVEAGLDEADAGKSAPWTSQDRDTIRQLGRQRRASD
ncbi:MAG: hypothetical protein JNM18_27300 [Planctomycetaceae bacterium]|nr:hypothetical protein [Planctomycetaceae bacterium]